MLKSRSSFTLIELLVVLAIVAILSVVVIMTLNPSELLKQARDSNRLSDLGTLNTALAAYEADVNQGFMGTSSVVYVSIPDTSPTCANLGLPTSTGAGFTYHCVTSQNLKNSDGTGWIPVNFSQISFGSPISSLPVDPINTTSSGNYYTYVSGGSFILTAIPESAKQKTALSSNPNISNYPGVIAMGNNLSLSPLYNPSGLVGYWNFEEGVGTISPDRSGNGNDGTWAGSGTHYSTGKVGGYAAQFNGTDDWIIMPPSSVLAANDITMLIWVNIAAQPATHTGIITNKNGAAYGINLAINSNMNFESFVSDGSSGTYFYASAPGTSGINAWHYLAVTHSSAGSNKIYYNGLYRASLDKAIGYQSTDDKVAIGAFYNPGNLKINGYIDEVRIYNRVLSAAEIAALYNATK